MKYLEKKRKSKNKIKKILIFLLIIVFSIIIKKYLTMNSIKSFVEEQEIFIEKEIEIIAPDLPIIQKIILLITLLTTSFFLRGLGIM
jgi:heme/copper-type cytochrome/quinol oxidase subunit 3